MDPLLSPALVNYSAAPERMMFDNRLDGMRGSPLNLGSERMMGQPGLDRSSKLESIQKEIAELEEKLGISEGGDNKGEGEEKPEFGQPGSIRFT